MNSKYPIIPCNLFVSIQRWVAFTSFTNGVNKVGVTDCSYLFYSTSHYIVSSEIDNSQPKIPVRNSLSHNYSPCRPLLFLSTTPQPHFGGQSRILSIIIAQRLISLPKSILPL